MAILWWSDWPRRQPTTRRQRDRDARAAGLQKVRRR